MIVHYRGNGNEIGSNRHSRTTPRVPGQTSVQHFRATFPDEREAEIRQTVRPDRAAGFPHCRQVDRMVATGRIPGDVFGTPRRLGDILQGVGQSRRETERRCIEMKIKVIKVERIEATRPHPDPELEGGA
ncbi:hypothetical protein [Micromonospora coxensis]|uniref:hypothetical protein n=1 Tax=Micromonospora coxensis TaxID=356852 RepID=UPI0034245F09